MFDLNKDTRFILGRPCFMLSPIAELLRKGGHNIERKAEDEQSYVIYWLLRHWELHGENWPKYADEELACIKDKLGRKQDVPQEVPDRQ
jgi:hypothetical protein